LAHYGLEYEESGAMVKLWAAFQKLGEMNNRLSNVVLQKCLTHWLAQVSQQGLGAGVRTARNPIKNFR
jgi:hypothetical protein